MIPRLSPCESIEPQTILVWKHQTQEEPSTFSHLSDVKGTCTHVEGW